MTLTRTIITRASYPDAKSDGGVVAHHHRMLGVHRTRVGILVDLEAVAVGDTTTLASTVVVDVAAIGVGKRVLLQRNLIGVTSLLSAVDGVLAVADIVVGTFGRVQAGNQWARWKGNRRPPLSVHISFKIIKVVIT